MTVIPMSEPNANVELASQPTLDDLLFERYQVDTVKVTVSGTIEMPIASLRELGADLEPGDRVVFSCIGHVADMSSPYNLKDNNHRRRVVLRAEVLNGVHDVGRD